MVSFWIISIALALVLPLVPGTTPKKPDSGFSAHRRPSAPGRSQAMSSPTVHACQPGMLGGGTIMARFVFPQALGKAPVT